MINIMFEKNCKPMNRTKSNRTKSASLVRLYFLKILKIESNQIDGDIIGSVFFLPKTSLNLTDYTLHMFMIYLTISHLIFILSKIYLLILILKVFLMQ